MQSKYANKAITPYNRSMRICCSILFAFILSIQPAYPDSIQSPTMPGKLVDIGSHRLHINCKGEGFPTVIIDSGLGGFSLEWATIQKELFRNVRVCAYDRAGYGWSDVGPMPRTTRQISAELYKLLEATNIPGPYILVGHSFGGYNIRYFASEHPELVAGLVLVDASHPDQFDRLPRAEKSPSVKRPNSVTYRIIRPIMHDNYPADVKMLAYRLLMSYKARYTHLSEMDQFEASAHQVKATAGIPDVPLVVLTRGQRVWPHNDLGDRLEQTWDELQSELGYLTNMSVQVIAKKSGHSIHLDQPRLVTSVILNTVTAARKIQTEYLARVKINMNVGEPYNHTSLDQYFEIPMLDAYISQANYVPAFMAADFAMNSR